MDLVKNVMRNNLLIITLISFTSCEPIDKRLIIINNTNHTIIIGDRLWVSNPALYLDNKITIDNFDFNVNQVESKSSLKMVKKGSWESSFLKNDTIVILVYNKDSIIEKKLTKPSRNYNIEQIIYLSHSYVKRNDWKITIDPKNTSKIVRL
ncbi:MAG: hypothetical protein ABIP27_16465 [Flavobacterium circumlabens]|uniref:hypothetical protein n=1 Tax=Flavobacterium circumlabens TaxID=2133765 RepID=UPI00326405A5